MIVFFFLSNFRLLQGNIKNNFKIKIIVENIKSMIHFAYHSSLIYELFFEEKTDVLLLL